MNTQTELNVSNEAEILERISKARSGPELVTESTDEALDLVVKPDEVEVEEVEAVAETIEAEPETVETDETIEPELDQEDSFIDFKGEEVSFTQIEEWKQSGLRQSDYTRKTQEVAETRKANEATKEALTAKGLILDDSIAQLTVFIDEFNQTDFGGYTLDELRENDPGEYLKVTELQTKRKEALKSAKKLKSDDLDADSKVKTSAAINQLAVDNGWLKDGKETPAYAKDTAIVKSYLTGLGYTEAMMQGVLTTGQGQVFIDAAKYHAGKQSNAAITKKVRKAPVVTKPGGASKSTSMTNLEKARANHKKLGTVESGVALRKAQRQFKGD